MPNPSHTLDRSVGRWDIVGMTVNGIIGAGIFGLPSRLFALAGAWSVPAVIACAALCALVVWCFAEVGSRFDRTGGPYLYARTAFGEVAGFELGWLIWLRTLTSVGAICNLFISYLAVLWPAAGGPARPWIIGVVIVALTVPVLRGMRGSASICNAFTIAKVVALVLFVLVGLWFVRPERLAPGPWPGLGTFSSAVLPLVFAFAGFDTMMVAAGEMRRPQRDVAFGLFVSLAIVAVLYVLIQITCVGTLPALATSEQPLAQAAVQFAGDAGRWCIAVGALISTLGAMLGTILISPRILYALAEQGQLPGRLAVTHARFRTPHVVILVTSVGMLIVTLSGSFIYAVTINAMIRLITYAATCVAMIVLRRRAGAPKAAFRVPAGDLVAGASTLLCLWLLSRSTFRETRDLLIAAAVGLVFHLVWRAVGRQRGAEGTAVAEGQSPG